MDGQNFGDGRNFMPHHFDKEPGKPWLLQEEKIIIYDMHILYTVYICTGCQRSSHCYTVDSRLQGEMPITLHSRRNATACLLWEGQSPYSTSLSNWRLHIQLITGRKFASARSWTWTNAPALAAKLVWIHHSDQMRNDLFFSIFAMLWPCCSHQSFCFGWGSFACQDYPVKSW